MFTIEEAYNLVTKEFETPYDKEYIHDLGDRWAFHYDGSLGEYDGAPSPITFNKSTGEIKCRRYQDVAEELDNAPVVSIH